jgi:hypothetical protein
MLLLNGGANVFVRFCTKRPLRELEALWLRASKPSIILGPDFLEAQNFISNICSFRKVKFYERSKQAQKIDTFET